MRRREKKLMWRKHTACYDLLRKSREGERELEYGSAWPITFSKRFRSERTKSERHWCKWISQNHCPNHLLKMWCFEGMGIYLGVPSVTEHFGIIQHLGIQLYRRINFESKNRAKNSYNGTGFGIHRRPPAHPVISQIFKISTPLPQIQRPLESRHFLAGRERLQGTDGDPATKPWRFWNTKLVQLLPTTERVNKQRTFITPVDCVQLFLRGSKTT